MGAVALRYGDMIFPREPNGKSPLAAWGRKVVQCLRALEIRPARAYRVKQSSAGTILDFTSIGGGGQSETYWRGVWTATPTESYMIGNMVVVQAGAAAGTYVCVTDENTSDPSTGIGWVQIAPGGTIGEWT